MITKQQILDASEQLIFHNGDVKVSLRKIASTIGCAPPSIYYYYANKAAIMQDLWERVMERTLTEVERHIDAQDAILAYGEYWLRHPQQFRIFMMSQDFSISLDRSVNYQKICDHFSAQTNQPSKLIMASLHGILLSISHQHMETNEAQRSMVKMIGQFSFEVEAA